MLWLILVILILGATYCFYWVTFYNPESRHAQAVPLSGGDHRMQEEKLNRDMEIMPCETVWIRSRDGLRLCGHYYHVSDSPVLHIQFHGYRGSGIRDFSAGNHVARSLGYNTLVVDQRAHGHSQGRTMTFGIRERWDCVCWAEYAADRFGPNARIILSGVSMGAATVLMASSLSLPDNVVGIIGDCPYTSPMEIICKVCRDIHIPWILAVPLGTLSAMIWGGFWLPGSGAVGAVAETSIPVLLIHGKEDKYVPPEMSRRIQSNCASRCYLELFPGAAHAGSCLTDTTRYQRIMEGFVSFCLDKYER